MAQDFVEMVISKLKDPATKVTMSYGTLVISNGKHEVTCCDNRISIRNLDITHPSESICCKVEGVINKWRYYRAWRNRIEQECAKCL